MSLLREPPVCLYDFPLFSGNPVPEALLPAQAKLELARLAFPSSSLGTSSE